MPFRSVPIIAATLLILSGCSAVQGTLSVETYLDREITGDTLAACTARGYQAIARRKGWRERNFADAAILVAAAQAVQAGAPPPLLSPDFRTSRPAQVRWLAAKREAAQTLIARADPMDCRCGDLASAYDDWVLLSLSGDVVGAEKRFEIAAAACEGRAAAN